MKVATEAFNVPAPSAGTVSSINLKPLVRVKDDAQFYRGLAAYLSELAGATSLVYAERDGAVSILATRLRVALPAGVLDSKEVKASLVAGLKSQNRIVLKLTQAALVLWAVPVEGEAGIGLAMLFGAAAFDSRMEERLLQLMAVPQSLFAQRRLQMEGDTLKRGLDQAIFFLDTIYRSASAPSFRRGLQSLAEDLRTFVGAEYVAVGLGSELKCKVEALSPASKVDQRSQVIVRTAHLMTECVVISSMIGWPQEALPKLPGLNLASDQDFLLEELKVSVITCHVLKTASGETIGAWACFWQATPGIEKVQMADALTPHVGAIAKMIRLARPPGILGVYQRHFADAKWARKLLVGAVITAFAAAMFIRMPYKLGAPCWIDPELRRQVAVPFDGVLARAHVKPGDHVAKGQIVAELDGKDIGWKLADVRSRLNSLTKKRDQALAAENMSETQLASLEMASLEVERGLLVYQSENLLMRSPLDGVIITGDLAQSEGVPVQRGQRLFDIAPIDTFTVQIAVPAAEISHVEPGMPVSVRLESETDFQQTGMLESLEPASRVHEARNVFLGTATLTNAGGRLRPGMQGKAQIIAKPKRLGWILFHRPFDFIRLHLPW
jgi:Barrel-sandwich domain of CusB or HlyD membrane-fusion